MNILKNSRIEFRRTPSNNLLKYIYRWCINTDKHLGIVQFFFDLHYLNKMLGYPPLVKDFVPEYGIAPWAYKALKSVYHYEPYMTREDRSFAIETYRGGSKTFWFGFVSTIYDVLVGQYGIYWNKYLLPEVDYQVIRSKSANESKKRFLGISSFFNKPLVIKLFGELKPSYKEVKTKEAKDAGNLLILSNGYIMEASGIDQPSRGSNINQIRPKKIVFDDPQNRENTRTPGRREQCDNEVMNESFAAIDDKGLIIFIGNRVHEDDTLSKLMDDNNVSWKKFRFAITVTKDGKPGIGDLDNEIPEWHKRYDIDRIKKIKEWYIQQPKLGGIRGFLKEYFNILKSSAEYEVKYHNATFFREFGYNWLKFPNGEILNVNIFIGVDPAISKNKNSSDAAIVVIAVDYLGNRYVLQYSSGKYELFDKPLKQYEEEFKSKILFMEIDKYKLDKVGTVNEVCRLVLKYNPDSICVESGVGVQEVFFTSIKDLLQKLNQMPVIMPFTPRESKTDKLRQVPLGYVEAGLYYVRSNMNALINEIVSFGEGSRKDLLDAVFNAEMVLQIPSKLVYNPLGVHKVSENQYDIRDKYIKPLKGEGMLNELEPWVIL